MKTTAVFPQLRGLFLSIISFILVSLLSTEVHGQSWYNSSWLYRKAITIDYTKVGTGPHTNFPVLINRTDADLQARAQTDADDILFTLSDGTTKLDHEIENYTSASGTIVSWVEIPSLSSSANTVIYMYYGNAAAAAQQNIPGTWDATFKGVYHLNNAFTDATSNAFNGTNTGTTNLVGKISNGRGFVRSDGSDFIQINGLMSSPTSFTLSAWATLTTADPNAAEIISIGDYSVLRYDEVGSNKTSGVAYHGASVWTTTASGVNYAGTGWHYVSYTFDDAGNSQKVYVDGTQVATSSATASPVYTGGGTNTFIGKHGNANINMDFDGTIDEARVSNASRSAGWVLTEYNNQNSPSTFYSVGSQESAKIFTGTGNFSDATKWTGGTLPVGGEHLIIDGACTVDNSGTTDNVAYATLTIGTATGRTLNWATGGTNRLNVTNVSAGAGASTLDMTNGGTLIIRGSWTSTNLTFTRGTGTIEVKSTITLPAAYTSYTNLTINSAGTVTLGVNNTVVNGSLNVTTGTLQLGTLNLTSGDLQGAGIIASSSGTPTLTVGSLNTSTTFSGIIGTGAIALTKNGTGTLTLSGTNTYTGLTTIAAGTLKLGSTAALGTTAGATSVTSGAVLDLNGINYSSAEVLTLAGTGISSGGCLINSNSTAATYAGSITLSIIAPQITANNPITLSGIISGGNTSGVNSLTVAGNSTLTGVLTVSGNNTYTGFTTINSGALLKIGANNALGAGAPNGATDAGDGNSTIINSGGVLDLNGITYTQYEGVRMYGAGFTAAGNGCVINSSSTTAIYSGCVDSWTASTLYIANPVTFNGMVQCRFFNSMTKTGSSILTLTPTGGDRTADSYITISAGTLKLGANLTETGSATVYTRIASGAVLDLNGFTCARYLYLNGTGISSGGALINGSATPATHSGSVILESASSIVGGAGTIAVTGTTTGAGFGLTLGGSAGGSVTNVISGTSTTLTKIGSGTWDLSALNTYTGTTTVSAGILRATNNTIVASTDGAFGNNASGLVLNGGTIQSNVATFSRPITVSATNSALDGYASARTISSTINNATGSTSYNLNVGGTTNGVLEGQNLTLSGVITNTPGTLSLIKVGTNTVSFSNQAVTIQGLTINAGTLTSTSGTLSVAGNYSNSGTFTHNSGTVNFNGTTVMSGATATNTFNNLTVAASSTVTSSAGITGLVVNGTLNTGTGAILDLGTNTLLSGTLGTISNSGTVKTSVVTATSALPFPVNTTWPGSGTVEYAALTGAQTIMWGTYNSLKLSNTSGVNSIPGNVTVNGIFTLSGGNVNTGSYLISITSTGSVSRTGGHVIGNFKKHVATGATTKIFEIGDATNYTPVTVAFASVTTADYLTASTVAGDHANIGTSNISSTKTANRTWTLTNQTIVFTTCDVTFTFAAGDLDGGAITGNFTVGRYSGGWTYPAVGTKTSTSTQATGLSAFGGFQVGEAACTTPAAPTVTSPVNYCQNATAAQLTATGTNLMWSTGTTSGSVGGTSTLTGSIYIAPDTSNNRMVRFTTTSNNVTIVSVDYWVDWWMTTASLQLGIFNNAGVLISSSSTIASVPSVGSNTKVTNMFNFIIATAGNYSIGVVSGTGIVSLDNPSFPITEASGTINITGVSPGPRCVNNIQFTTGGSSTAPTPVTTAVGTTNYTVTQTVGGCISPGATIAVVVSGPPTTSAAGADQTGAATCGLTTVTLAGNAPIVGTGAWSIVSGAGGTVTTPTSATSTFSGTAGTTYTLRWTISNSPCTASADDVVVTFTPTPAATISYAGSPYNTSGGTATVTFSGTTGGSYSSTTGLTINAATGDVTLGTSTPTTYTVTYTIAAAGGCSIYTTTTSITVISAKIFTGTGNFSDPTKWTGGTIPTVGENMIIDGACTVDNNVATDNIAYGTLTIGTATGRTLNWAASGTNRLNVSNVSAGAGASTLNMTNGGTLIIRGTWTSTNLTFTPGTGTIDLRSAITLPAAYATYYNLTINSPSNTVTAGVGTGVTNFSIAAGTVDLNTMTLTVTGTGTYTSGTINNGTVTSTGATTTFAGTVFGAVVNATSNNLYLNGSTFNNTTSLTKNGGATAVGTGGNIYNGVTTLVNSGSGSLDLGNTLPETFNANLTINNTGASRVQIGISSVGNQFNGNTTINHGGNTVSLNTIIARNPGSTATFNGNLTLNCTNLNAVSGIVISNEGNVTINGNVIVSSTNGRGIVFSDVAGSVTLAAGYTISDAGAGSFTTGTLKLSRFSQTGATAQNTTLTGTALLQIGPSSTFNGNVNFVSPQVLLNGCTYNGTASFTKNGATNNLGNGGNTFNGATALTNSSSSYFATGFTTADIFNADVTATNTGTGFTALADEAAGTMFNGNIIVNSTNGAANAGVAFGNGPGTAVTATLAAGKTISVGGTGFTAGRLQLRRMIQSGATAQSFTLAGTSILYLGSNSTFNGTVNFISPQMYLNGCTYNGTASFTKNGATDNISTGANIFNAATTITNSGAGFLRLANTTADNFNGDATFIQTGSGLLQPAYANNSTFAGNLSTAGTSTAISFGTGNGTVTLNGTIAQAIAGSLSPTFYNLIISNTGNTVTPVVNSSITNNLSVTSGTFDLGTYTANRLTAGGTLTISNGATLKVGGTNTIPSNFSAHSIGATSTVEYNGTNQSLAVLNSSQNYGHLTIAGSGTKTMAGNSNVVGTLTFTNGTITTGAYTIYLNSTGTVSRTSGHVAGNFKKYIATGATNKTFEIGDATNYTPVTIAFASVTTAGDLTASVTATDHPNLASSGIRTDKSVNRYWGLTNSGIAFITATATLNWVGGDLDAGTTTANFIVGKYNNPTWTLPTVAAPLATSIQASGLTSIGDLAIGEGCAVISQIPLTNLIANYKFAGNADDAAGNNNGTLQNAPTLTADRFGNAANAYSFNGSSQYVSTTNSYANPGNYTMSVWFKTATSTGGLLMGLGSSRTGSSVNYDRNLYMNNAGKLYFGNNPGGNNVTTIFSPSSYNDNNWHLATATLSGTAGMILYVDGVQVAINAGLTSAQNYTGYWRIGYDNLGGWTSSPSSYYFNGTLDDALVYHRALSSAEVTTLYNSPDGAGNSGPVCIGTSISLSATTASGATYAWTGPNSYTSSSQNPSFIYSAPFAGTYTLVVTAAGCSATAYTNINSSTTSNQWTGNTSTAWATAGNWCNGVVPASNANITIPTGLSVYPVISTTIAVNNITIPSGASLTVSGGTLQIAGSITNSGTFTASSGTIELNGSSLQTIAANTFAGNSLLNLTINNDVTLAGTTAITGTLTIGTSGKTFATGGYLTLKSSALRTAKIAALPVDVAGAATSFITGIVAVERYIPQHRSWRLLTAPLSNTGSIYNSWQNAGVYQAGKGMFISGPSPNGANGLDASTQNTVSMKGYSSATQAFANITNTKTSNLSNSTGSADNIGYFAFVRGDRNPNNLYSPNTNNTTLTSAGTLQTGKQQFTASATLNAYTLVGNPYASPIDFNNVQRTHIRKRFYAWDATTNSTGAYVVLDDIDGNGIFSSSDPGSLQDKNIQSGQAFFVETDTVGTAALTFYETSKSTISSYAGFRPSDDTKSMAIILNLLAADNSVIKADATMAEFDASFNAGFDFQDAIKFTNTNETFSLLRNGVAIALERRPLITKDDTLFLKLIQATQRNYQLVFNASNLEQPGLVAFLEDSYTGLATPVNLQGSTSFNFTIDAAAASIKPDRFRVIFKMPIVLPVDFSDVKAWQQGDDIAVKWTVENQLNVQQYEVEKSTDGIHFTKVNSQPATGTTGSLTYNWLDTHTVEGNNFYRIRNVDINGVATYSKVVKVSMGKSAGRMTIYPNPVTDGILRLQLKNKAAGQYHIRLLNAIGQVLLDNSFPHAGGTATEKITLSNKIAKGNYTLEITGPDKSKTSISVLNQ